MNYCSLISIKQICFKISNNLLQTEWGMEPGKPLNILVLDTETLKCTASVFQKNFFLPIYEVK